MVNYSYLVFKKWRQIWTFFSEVHTLQSPDLSYSLLCFHLAEPQEKQATAFMGSVRHYTWLVSPLVHHSSWPSGRADKVVRDLIYWNLIIVLLRCKKLEDLIWLNYLAVGNVVVTQFDCSTATRLINHLCDKESKSAGHHKWHEIDWVNAK